MQEPQHSSNNDLTFLEHTVGSTLGNSALHSLRNNVKEPHVAPNPLSTTTPQDTDQELV